MTRARASQPQGGYKDVPGQGEGKAAMVTLKTCCYFGLGGPRSHARQRCFNASGPPAMLVLYGESRMKDTGVHESDPTAHG